MKYLQFPRGSSEVADGILGKIGTFFVDLSRGELRVHDGVKLGGHRLPTVDTVQALIQAHAEGSGGTLLIVQSAAELADTVPDASTLALIGGAGLEDAYIWHSGTGDSGTIPSSSGGYWHLLDAPVGQYIRLWRAGLINLQIGGAAPGANQAKTAWIDTGVAKLWNGATYVVATPLLFANMMSAVGSYASTIVLPDQLAEVTTTIADLNTPAKSGWYKSGASATHSPVAGVHAFDHRQIDATNAVQLFHVQNSATFDIYIRYLIASVWTSWNLITPSYSLVTQAEAEAGTVTTIRWCS